MMVQQQNTNLFFFLHSRIQNRNFRQTHTHTSQDAIIAMKPRTFLYIAAAFYTSAIITRDNREPVSQFAPYRQQVIDGTQRTNERIVI